MYNEKITPVFFKEVLDEIARWQNLLQQDPDNELLYELAFFKIYLKFEKEYVRSFIAILSNPHLYEGNEINYRVLPLFSETEKEETNPFEKFLRSIGGNSYYLSIDKISKLYKEFMLEPNPFSVIHTSTLTNGLSEMTIVRNFFAHESQDAKKKYLGLLNLEEQSIYSVGKWLKKSMRGTTETRFSYYINVIKMIINIIQDNTCSRI